MLTTIKEICRLPDEYTFNDHTGMRVVEVDEDRNVTLILKTEPYMLNPAHALHGGVLFTLCDTAVGVYLKIRDRHSVTVNTTINYYRAAVIGDTLRAKVSERKKGKTLSFLNVEVTDSAGTCLAEACFTMYLARKSSSKPACGSTVPEGRADGSESPLKDK